MWKCQEAIGWDARVSQHGLTRPCTASHGLVWGTLSEQLLYCSRRYAKTAFSCELSWHSCAMYRPNQEDPSVGGKCITSQPVSHTCVNIAGFLVAFDCNASLSQGREPGWAPSWSLTYSHVFLTCQSLCPILWPGIPTTSSCKIKPLKSLHFSESLMQPPVWSGRDRSASPWQPTLLVALV